MCVDDLIVSIKNDRYVIDTLVTLSYKVDIFRVHTTRVNVKLRISLTLNRDAITITILVKFETIWKMYREVTTYLLIINVDIVLKYRRYRHMYVTYQELSNYPAVIDTRVGNIFVYDKCSIRFSFIRTRFMECHTCSNILRLSLATRHRVSICGSDSCNVVTGVSSSTFFM